MINEKYKEIHELRAYLNSTDYMVIKSYETDYVIPQEVLTKRAEARGKINVLESEITQPEQEIKESEIINTIQ